MQSHAELQQLILDYVASQLDPDVRERLEQHVATCQECHELVLSCEALAGTARGDDHPTPGALREAARGSALAPDVARHVATCGSCALEVEHWRREAPQRPSEVGTAWARWLAPRPLALGLAAGISLVLAVALWTWPRLDTSRGFGSPAPLVLDGPERGRGRTPSVSVEADQSHLPVFVRLAVPPAVEDDAWFETRVVAAGSGSVAWTHRIQARRIREQQARTWASCFLLPARALPPGRYVFRVGPETDPQEPVLELTFEIEPAR